MRPAILCLYLTELLYFGVSVPTGQPDVPVLAITPESNIREGDTFTINCLSDGSPSPEYHWMVPTGANVTYARNKSMVLVSKAGKIHNGVYTCEVRNEYGQVRGSQSVQVTPPTRGQSRRHKGDIISAVLVLIIAAFILWKTRILSSGP